DAPRSPLSRSALAHDRSHRAPVVRGRRARARAHPRVDRGRSVVLGLPSAFLPGPGVAGLARAAGGPAAVAGVVASAVRPRSAYAVGHDDPGPASLGVPRAGAAVGGARGRRRDDHRGRRGAPPGRRRRNLVGRRAPDLRNARLRHGGDRVRYERVHLAGFGVELAPVVVTTEELEERLAPVYAALKIAPGQLEHWTGIVERRWWEPGASIVPGAAAAAARALEQTGIPSACVEALVYAGVCREHFEPATACHVAAAL